MPSLPDNDKSCNPHLASLVAIDIVTQVLEEAQDIVNAAKDSGQLKRCIWKQKKGNGEIYKKTDILGITDIKGYGQDTECKINQEDDRIITTSQKEIDNITKNYNDAGFIGQGDEHMQKRNTGLRPQSMVIDCLFDMSELEQAANVEIDEDILEVSESRNFLTSTVTQLVDSYVNSALNIVCGGVFVSEQHVMAESNHSSYSFLTDVLVSDIAENNETVTFYVNNVKDEEEIDPSGTRPIKNMDTNEDVEEITKQDIDLYEKTFCTLNRDYDKCSEDEHYLEDQKSLVMQEVELPKNISSEVTVMNAEAAQTLTKMEDRITSAVIVDTQKPSLVKRCRLQGARLMKRLRSWWWKPRLIGKRKESRSGLMSGMCPLSPKTRNRVGSLLDNHSLRSPTPSRTVAWKFNTLNEALIHSYSKKEFELNSSDHVGEY